MQRGHFCFGEKGTFLLCVDKIIEGAKLNDGIEVVEDSRAAA